MIHRLFLFLLTICTSTSVFARQLDPQKTASFEKEIEKLRQRYHIPGISVGIIYGNRLAWSKGFGYADVEQQKVPDENTIYQIASISKTFGAIIFMQQVQQGTLSLDDPISKYNINLGARWGSNPDIKLRHLLTHTAMGNTRNSFKPGYVFRYNGDWYAKTGKAISTAAGQSYGQLLIDSIISPLGLKNTVPSTDDSASFALSGQDKEDVLSRTARPYDWHDNALHPVRYKYAFGTAAGIMSTVADLAIYNIAIDEGRLLDSARWKQMFTPHVAPNGRRIQYGLGWFVTTYKKQQLRWHTGWWVGYSALMIKVPSRNMTVIFLANSQDLSRPFYHLIRPVPGTGLTMNNPFRSDLNSDITASDFGKAFLEHFVQ